MVYALVQKSIDPPTKDQCHAAFGQLRGGTLTPADAGTVSRDAFGVIAEWLTAERADELRQAFANVGYDTAVVDHNDLFGLPEGRAARKLEMTDDALVLYDALDRLQFIPWGEVILVAAGLIGKLRLERETELVAGNTTGGPFEFTRSREVNRLFNRVELILGVDPHRVRIDAKRFNYGCLGGRVTNRAIDNYATLVTDLVSRSTVAMCNRGAVAIASGRTLDMVYPNKRAFEEELAWHIWRLSHT